MINAVNNRAATAGRTSFARQDAANSGLSFKQQYANAVGRNSQTQVNGCGYTEIRGGLEPQDIANFYNNLDRQADGSDPLSAADIRDLKSRYDFDNLTPLQRLALLLELNQRNILSYEDCCRSQERYIDPSTLMGAENSIRRMVNDENIDPVLRNALSLTMQNMETTQLGNATDGIRPSYLLEPTNIYEEFRNYAIEWRMKYDAILENYGEERPEYLEYANSYARIAEVLKSLMS